MMMMIMNQADAYSFFSSTALYTRNLSIFLDGIWMSLKNKTQVKLKWKKKPCGLHFCFVRIPIYPSPSIYIPRTVTMFPCVCVCGVCMKSHHQFQKPESVEFMTIDRYRIYMVLLSLTLFLVLITTLQYIIAIRTKFLRVWIILFCHPIEKLIGYKYDILLLQKLK